MTARLEPPEGPVPANWHETFFDGLMNAFWLGAVPEEQTGAEAEFLMKQLRLPPGARVLDLGCGAGRMCLALAARGCAATGLDISDDFLGKARAAAPEGADLTWLKQSLADPDLPAAAFDGAFMLGNSFPYMPPEDTARMLIAIGRALTPGGRLCLNTAAAAECFWPHFEAEGDYTAGGVRLRIAHRFDPVEGAVLTRFEASDGETAETRDGVQYIHTIREIAGMLAQAGLTVTGLFAEADGAVWEPGDPHVYVIAEKSA